MDTERERLEHRLVVMDALCAAQARREEVVAAVAEADDADQAAARITELLGLSDEVAASAVLDQQVRRWTRQERERMERTRDELRAELDATTADEPEPVSGAVGVDWDAVYAEGDRIWSGAPNGALVAEVAALPPGTAVDVGCGEGADAVWLAQRGWRVTALDVSAIALARAADHAAAAGVDVELVHAGLLGADLGRYDLVSAQYPALLQEQGRSLAALLDLVAPGGTLLFVHHAQSDLDHARREGFDPADHVLPSDALPALGDAWEVLVHEERPRSVTGGAGAAHTVDVVLRARRRTG